MKHLKKLWLAIAAVICLSVGVANPAGATINTAVVNGCVSSPSGWNWKARFGGTKSTPGSVFKSYSLGGVYQAYTTGTSFTYYAVGAPGYVVEWNGVNILGSRYYSEGGGVNCP